MELKHFVYMKADLNSSCMYVLLENVLITTLEAILLLAYSNI